VYVIRSLKTRLRPARLRRCAVCHASLLPDDALGIFGGTLAHAECALFGWLGSRERMRDLLADA